MTTLGKIGLTGWISVMGLFLAACSEDPCDKGAYKCDGTVLMYCGSDESWSISKDCGSVGKGCASKCASGAACCID